MKPQWILAMILALVVQNSFQATLETTSAQQLAQEYRIETDLYLNKDAKKPSSENLTLFSNSAVYDFQLSPNSETPAEVVIYVASKKEFVLLDPSRKIKCEIGQEKIAEIVKAMKSDMGLQKKVPHLLTPQLTETFDEATKTLTLSNAKLVYRCKGKAAKNKGAMESYYDFVDQYALLNVTDPRKMPPFARLELNAAIKKRDWMPSWVEFEMEIKPSVLSRKQKLNLMTKHFVIWRLSKTDHRRIESAKQMWSTYKSVDLDEYRKLGTTPAMVKDSTNNR